MFTSRAVLAALVAATAALAPAAARAETFHTCTGFITTLPTVITTQGTWCLQGDLATSIAAGEAIRIAANNVTIDCNGYKLGGLGAGTATNVIGIYAENRLNATVRDCTLRGFRGGMLLAGNGGGHLIEHNRLDANRQTGIDVHGDGSVVRDNLIFDTGGTALHNHVVGISTTDNVDVRDNIIDGLVPDAATVDAYVSGIFLQSNTRGAVVGNRIGGLVPTGDGVARGIYNNSSESVTVVDNIVVGDDGVGSVGIRCTSSLGVAKDNVVLQFATAVSGCTNVNTTTPP